MAVKIGFVSLGCNKNLCDTENMMGLLCEDGFELTVNPEEADVCTLWQVLEQVNLADFLRSEKGLDTMLNEKASNLSGGQVERSAL